MTRTFIERWGDMRDNCDQALKLIGQLPSAVASAQNDPEFIDQVIVDLSEQLCCLDAHIGEERPSSQDATEAAIHTDTMTLSKGQVEYLTSLFHLASDRACQLLVILRSPEAALALEDDTVDSIANGLAETVWRIRSEMNIPLPEADPANGDRPEQSTQDVETRQGAAGGGRGGKGTRRKTEVADSAVSVPSFVDDTAQKTGTPAPGPDEPFPAAYIIARERGIASWLTELTELTSELIADPETPIDREAVQYLHERLWKMRWHFGYCVGETDKGEAAE